MFSLIYFSRIKNGFLNKTSAKLFIPGMYADLESNSWSLKYYRWIQVGGSEQNGEYNFSSGLLP